ncbi:MAG: hypothetical protein KTR22_04785 [Flavobacteriaceae bacterium]|nr:hypothetical protein [Flavobacteriaceae bacterium]
MKNLLLLLLLVAYTGHAQISRAKRPKEIARTLCESFTQEYASYESYANNRWVYIKTVEVELVKHPAEKRESIIQKLHEYCPAFLEYATVSRKMKAESEGNKDAFRLWDVFIANENETPWTDGQKQRFLKVCNAVLTERENTEALCQCTINKIAERLTAQYFLGLSTKDQAYLGGQVGYVYCSD